MIKYNVVAKKNPQNKTVKYYAQVVTDTAVDLDTIAERIEKRSTLSTSDIKAAFDALQYELIQSLLEGHSVRLGDIGSFHLTLQSKGAETADSFKTDNIENVAIQWVRPAKMRNAFKVGSEKLKFEKA